ncbi:MAG: hypothetical protein AAF600_07270 [Bacteroidota bacterium]
MNKILLINVLISISTLTFGQNRRVLDSFKQGSQKGTGNCASIAVIKASIDRYGLGNVFKSVRDEKEKKYYVILKSGKELTLTFEEIKDAAKAARFVESNNTSLKLIKLYADTCFAIIAKHIQVEQSFQTGPNNYSTFKEALDDLNNGFSTYTIAKSLGLEIERFKARPREIREKSGAVVYNVYHAVYSTYGIYDEAGDKDGVALIEKFKFKRAGLKCGFLFCGPSGAFEIKTR